MYNVQRRFKLYTRWFGGHDWSIHVILLAVIWTTFLIALFTIQLPNWKLPASLRSLGVIAFAGGMWLVIATWIRMGTAGVCNGWFFGRGPTRQFTGGVFRLRNPMYTGFTLLFIGAAFWLENAAYLFFVVTSFLLLNLVQAKIENPKSSEHKT